PPVLNVPSHTWHAWPRSRVAARSVPPRDESVLRVRLSRRVDRAPRTAEAGCRLPAKALWARRIDSEGARGARPPTRRSPGVKPGLRTPSSAHRIAAPLDLDTPIRTI